jgi:hypothetical protein
LTATTSTSWNPANLSFSNVSFFDNLHLERESRLVLSRAEESKESIWSAITNKASVTYHDPLQAAYEVHVRTHLEETNQTLLQRHELSIEQLMEACRHIAFRNHLISCKAEA